MGEEESCILDCVSSDHAYQNSIELFIPIVHALRNNLAVSINILTKWQPPIWLRFFIWL